jgi:hypothetical protein
MGTRAWSAWIARHHLHACAHSQSIAGQCLLRGPANGAQARGAIAVDGQRRDGVAPARLQQRQLGDVGALLAGLGDAACHHIFHVRGLQLRPGCQRLKLAGQQLNRGEAAQRPFVIATPARRAHRLDDDRMVTGG